MTGVVECRYDGRDFTTEEMALLRALIAASSPLNRHALSREFCRLIGWSKPDGGLKDMMARVTMLAMHRDGLIVLPPPKWRQNRLGPIVSGPDTEPPRFPASLLGLQAVCRSSAAVRSGMEGSVGTHTASRSGSTCASCGRRAAHPALAR